jgi:hypothetical protein
MGLETWDWIAIGGYFGLLLAIAWWVILRRKDTADDYFLAGRNLGWWVLRGPGVPTEWQWLITSCTPGAC